MNFTLGPGLDSVAIAPQFAGSGRLQIPNFLRQDGAIALLREISESRRWRLAINRGQETVDLDPADMAAWDQGRRAAFEQEVVQSGRDGFQFRYDAIRLPARGTGIAPDPEQPMLSAFAQFLSSPPIIDFVRTLTGMDDIAFADAHASRYTAGHFLTAHDDRHEGMNRRCAFVMNLTPIWRPDWGGLLLFYGDDGNVDGGFTPAFNRLNLFRVPQPHSVTWVAPLAAAPRLSVTGWFRAGSPD